MAETLRRCSCCGLEKPPTEFWKKTTVQRGRKYVYLQPACTVCSLQLRTAAKYGMTLEQLFSFYESHGNKCDICGAESEADGRNNSPNKYGSLVIDHCHTTGEVRGLLCSSCNHGLGKFRDSEELLLKAVEYLCK